MDQYDEKTLADAVAILEATPLIDGHNDWAWYIREHYANKIENADFAPDADLRGHVDLKRLRAGRMGGMFLSAYMPGLQPADDFSDGLHLERVRDTLQQIDLIHRLIDRYADHLQLIHTAAAILPTFRQGRIPCLIGIEGLHQIGNSASVLRTYHRLGARYVTLTHVQNNLYADSADSTAPVHRGLSALGRRMIQEMNRIGMIIDLAHVSDAVMHQVLDASAAPVLFTHSNARALCDVRRNVPDAVLDRIPANGGVVMVTMVPRFTHPDPATRASHRHLVDHVEYVARRIGYDHLGVGTDFDGTAHTVAGLADAACLPALVAEMLTRGIARDDIAKVLGRNVIRVLAAVEAVAHARRSEPALEDEGVVAP